MGLLGKLGQEGKNAVLAKQARLLREGYTKDLQRA